VGIENPLEGDGLSLIIGAFVKVKIIGRQVANTIKIPAEAIKDGNHILYADMNDKLARKDVTLGWLDGKDAYIIAGIEEGTKIVVTPIGTPIYGNPLSLIVDEK